MKRVVVIGAGLAGLVAANRLAAGGARVTLLSKGLGGLQLGQGTIDVFGYGPERVTNPIRTVQALPGTHPYTRIGADKVLTGLAFLKQLLPDLLVGDPEANYQLPTAVGAIRPTCLAQPSMVAGNLTANDRVVIVGLRQLKDFHPQLIAENLARTDLPSGGRAKVRHLLVDFPVREEVDTSGLSYARAFDDPGTRERFARTVINQLETDEIVGLPAVLGVHDPNAWRKVAEKLGHPVFEIPLPPPSVPGIRLNEALTAIAKAAGVRFVPGTRAFDFSASDGRITSVRIAVEPAGREFAADAFVLATGGFESGALELDSHGEVHETLFGLPLDGLDNVPLIHGEYWGDPQPLFDVGVRVGNDLKPLDASGAPVYANLWAAGGILAGSSGWAEKSGDGVALASAIGAADSILKELA